MSAPLKRGYLLEELGALMLATVRAMTPEEKAALRRQLRYSVMTKAEKRKIN